MWICIITLLVLCGMYIPGIKYKHIYLAELMKSDSKIKVLYPAVLFWLSLTGYLEGERCKRRMEILQLLQPGRDIRINYYEKICKKVAILYAVLFFSSIIGVLVQGANHSIMIEKYGVKRPQAGLASRDETFYVHLEKQGKKTKEKVTIEIDARKYTRQELDLFKKEAKEFVLEHIIGENPSLDQVSVPLNLIKKVPGNPYKIIWHLDEQDMVEEDGSINNKRIQEKVLVVLRLEISYEGEEEYMDIPIEIVPYKYTWQEEAKESFLRMVKRINEENLERSSFVLPSHIGKIKVAYELKRDGGAKKLILCAILGCVVMWFYWEERIKREKRNRDQECQIDYPNIVYKLTLLLGAGMTLKTAWGRTIQDYLKEKEDGKIRYAYEEMLVTWNEIESGIPEQEAFSRFGKRMKLRSYLRFSSLVAQNLKKGNRSFLIQLEAEAREAREERKQMARKLGEEAGIKLLLPMMIMLIIVLVIVMLPAFMSFAKGGF